MSLELFWEHRLYGFYSSIIYELIYYFFRDSITVHASSSKIDMASSLRNSVSGFLC